LTQNIPIQSTATAADATLAGVVACDQQLTGRTATAARETEAPHKSCLYCGTSTTDSLRSTLVVIASAAEARFRIESWNIHFVSLKLMVMGQLVLDSRLGVAQAGMLTTPFARVSQLATAHLPASMR
jgi:hypothetical protein